MCSGRQDPRQIDIDQVAFRSGRIFKPSLRIFQTLKALIWLGERVIYVDSIGWIFCPFRANSVMVYRAELAKICPRGGSAGRVRKVPSGEPARYTAPSRGRSRVSPAAATARSLQRRRDALFPAHLCYISSCSFLELLNHQNFSFQLRGNYTRYAS